MLGPDKLNEALESAIRDLAARRPALDTLPRRKELLKCLGLSPLPPKSELHAEVRSTDTFEGYTIEKIVYQSRLGVFVTAHLYLPMGDGPFPAVLSPHGHWSYKKSEPVVQARAIGLALFGIATLVVDSPGYSCDANAQNERISMGPHEDWFMCMGAPLQGVYVWDLMRGIDYLETRNDIDAKRIGVTGASGGGTVAVYLFAVEPRLTCAAPVCAAISMETQPKNGCLCNHVPGVLQVGDRTDLLAIGAPRPLLMVGATEDWEFPPDAQQRGYEKLRRSHSAYKSEAVLRKVTIEGPHDYNRRMREVVYAFFCQHLLGEPQRPFKAELRPLTDGYENPYPANTLEPTDSRLSVFGGSPPASTTFMQLTRGQLVEPYPEAFVFEERAIQWGRYVHLVREKVEPQVRIVDSGTTNSKQIALPVDAVDKRHCIYLGISLPEFFAQWLHLTLPGVPDGWERTGLAGDAVTAMIASMKTLVSKAEPETPVSSVVADGPVASMTAKFLQLVRPELEVELSHDFQSWLEVFELQNPLLTQPGARYLAWPFAARRG